MQGPWPAEELLVSKNAVTKLIPTRSSGVLLG